MWSAGCRLSLQDYKLDCHVGSCLKNLFMSFSTSSANHWFPFCTSLWPTFSLYSSNMPSPVSLYFVVKKNIRIYLFTSLFILMQLTVLMLSLV